MPCSLTSAKYTAPAVRGTYTVGTTIGRERKEKRVKEEKGAARLSVRGEEERKLLSIYRKYDYKLGVLYLVCTRTNFAEPLTVSLFFFINLLPPFFSFHTPNHMLKVTVRTCAHAHARPSSSACKRNPTYNSSVSEQRLQLEHADHTTQSLLSLFKRQSRIALHHSARTRGPNHSSVFSPPAQ